MRAEIAETNCKRGRHGQCFPRFFLDAHAFSGYNKARKNGLRNKEASLMAIFGVYNGSYIETDHKFEKINVLFLCRLSVPRVRPTL